MTRALVIGGTGFLGRTLCQRARDAGLDPVVFAPDADAGAGDIPGDVLEGADLKRALDHVRPAVVFHLAAFGIGGAGLIQSALLNPVEAARVNIVGFVSACQLASEQGVPRFVWSSSTSVYGSSADHGLEPLDESITPRPDTVYGATKLACELIVGPLTAASSTKAVGLRLPIVYGAGRYPGALGALTDFVADVAAGRPASFAATDQPFDWIHAVDAADALLLAAGFPCRQTVYNVVGHHSTLAEMARAVAAHATAAAQVTLTTATPAVPALMDGRAFADELSFKPSFDLREGAGRYVADERAAQ